jgi:hypothetical protein
MPTNDINIFIRVLIYLNDVTICMHIVFFDENVHRFNKLVDINSRKDITTVMRHCMHECPCYFIIRRKSMNALVIL